MGDAFSACHPAAILILSLRGFNSKTNAKNCVSPIANVTTYEAKRHRDDRNLN